MPEKAIMLLKNINKMDLLQLSMSEKWHKEVLISRSANPLCEVVARLS